MNTPQARLPPRFARRTEEDTSPAAVLLRRTPPVVAAPHYLGRSGDEPCWNAPDFASAKIVADNDARNLSR